MTIFRSFVRGLRPPIETCSLGEDSEGEDSEDEEVVDGSISDLPQALVATMVEMNLLIGRVRRETVPCIPKKQAAAHGAVETTNHLSDQSSYRPKRHRAIVDMQVLPIRFRLLPV
jgi:hypothetical protein